MSEKEKMTLEDQALEVRRQYMREYRKRNRDKVREWNSRYWKRKAAERQRKENDND